MQAIIPPDALYGTVEKRPKFAYVDAADFNDSKVRLKKHFFVLLISKNVCPGKGCTVEIKCAIFHLNLSVFNYFEATKFAFGPNFSKSIL